MVHGEFELIRALAQKLKHHQKEAGVIRGIGDDAAVLSLGTPPPYLVATVDLLVEEVHFSRCYITAAELGRRALAVSISDIAAMAATPRYALISLAIPEGFPSDFLETMYEGLAECGQHLSTAVVGGNVSLSREGLAIDVIVLGEVDSPLYRSGAKDKELLIVSGTLGASAAGLLWLRRYGRCDKSHGALAAAVEHCIRAHLEVTPRLQLAQNMAQLGATAMIDISDGLASEVNHLVNASQLGMVVDKERLPLTEEVKSLCAALGKDPVELALFGGEDYELLFTLPASRWPCALEASKSLGVPITIIGRTFWSPSPRAYLSNTRLPRKETARDARHGEEATRRWSVLLPSGWNHLDR